MVIISTQQKLDQKVDPSSRNSLTANSTSHQIPDEDIPSSVYGSGRFHGWQPDRSVHKSLSRRQHLKR